MFQDNSEIPVVLVTSGRNIFGLSNVIYNLFSYGNFTKFYIICPKNDIKKINIKSDIKFDINIINEELIIPNLTLNKIYNSLLPKLKGYPKMQLAGWYYQQFLKMAFCQSYNRYPYYLIWDADTLLTKKIEFKKNDCIFVTRGNEYHIPYFRFISKLFPDIKILNHSHISQHLMVNSMHMRSLLEGLSSSQVQWWEKILLMLDDEPPQQFSEYEMYANFVFNKFPEQYISIERNWFRYGGSLYKLSLDDVSVRDIKSNYVFIAFEKWDFGFICRLRSQILHFKNQFISLFNSQKYGK